MTRRNKAGAAAGERVTSPPSFVIGGGAMLKVWGRSSSFNLQKVMWLIGELDVPHEHIQAGGSHGMLDEPWFRAMNPHGRVPVIDDDGIVVWESHTILRYLAAKYGQGAGFWSCDPGQRSQVERWMDWSQATLQPDFLMGVFWGFYRTPEAKRNMPRVRAKIAACAEHFRLLDGVLADRPFLCGERLSLADIPAATCLYRYYGLEIERPNVPNVERWYARLQERPAYWQYVMVPFGDLFGRLDY